MGVARRRCGWTGRRSGAIHDACGRDHHPDSAQRPHRCDGAVMRVQCYRASLSQCGGSTGADARYSIAITLYAFAACRLSRPLPLSIRRMPLVGVGTAAATALAGVWALAVHHTPREGCARDLWVPF